MTRSLMSTMYFLSYAVEIPKQDIDEKRVAIIPAKKEYNIWREILESLLTIKCSNDKPKSAYLTVHYRNNWFYIDDRDLTSKKTFCLLQHIYAWQASQEAKDPPILTLPLG